MSLASVAGSAIAKWRKEPVRFVRDLFGVTPDPWQVAALEDFGSGTQRIALRASVGVGKSAFLAWILWLFLATRPHPKVLATSITGDNLRDGLWAECAKWQKRSALLEGAFQWDASRIALREHPETWFASARTWSRSASPEQQGEAMKGAHEDYILFLLDESGGIPDAVARTAENALATGIETRLVQGGNPMRLSGPLYRACVKDRDGWGIHEITGDPDNPKRSSRVSLDWARRQILENSGRDSNWVRVNVLGEFPASDDDALLSPDDVLRAMARNPAPAIYADSARIHSVDVARGGLDRSTIWERQGLLAIKPRVYRELVPHGLMTLAAHVASLNNERKPDALFVDETGLGAGVVDRLRQLQIPVIGVNFAAQASNPKKYRNKRTEIWFLLAAWVRAGGALPEVPELVKELTAPTYSTGSDGRLELAPKDDTKKLLGFSPDLGDGLAVGFGEPVLARAVRESEDFKLLQGERGGSWDYDPMAGHRRGVA